MPAAYTHFLIAREALSALPINVQNTAAHNLPLYFFGAQGADFYFFYPALRPKTFNLGSHLHRKGSLTTFRTLQALSNDRDILAYSLGYLTHYAADCTLHPYVYATAGNSLLRHTRLENLLDIRFKNAFPAHAYDGFFRKKLQQTDKELLLLVYTALAQKSKLEAPKRSAFFRAVSLFNAYLPLPNTLFDGASAKLRALVANEEKREWAYPANPALIRTDSADELFTNAVTLAVELIGIFFHAVKDRRSLPSALFSKSFLTGL